MKGLRFYNPVLIPLILVALLVLWLVTTRSGLQAVFSMVNQVAPVQIVTQGLEGRLADFSADELVVRLESATIRVQALQLRWSPVALLAKHLAIESFQSEKVDVERRAQSTTAPAAEFDLDALELPLGIDISDLGIGTIALDGREIARAIGLQAVFVKDNWQVHSFSAETSVGPVQLTGRIQPDQNWMHVLDVDALHERLGPITLKINGSRENTNASLAVAALGATSNLGITSPFADARWQITATVEDLAPFERNGRVTLSGQGNWEAGKLTVDAVIDGIQANVPSLAFQRTGNAVGIVLDGRVQEVPVSFNGRVSQLELTDGVVRIGEVRVLPDLAIRDGQLKIHGAWSELALDVQVRGDYHGPVTLEVLGTLRDYRQLTLDDINAKLLSGTIKGNGKMMVPDSGPTADISLAATGLSFVDIDPRLPTALSGRSDLALDANGLRITISDVTAAVPGSDVAVQGAGDVGLKNGELTAARFRLTAGTANQVNLQLADNRRDLDVTIDIQSLAAFMAGAQGAVRGTITINRQELSVRGTMTVADVEVPGVLSVTAADLEGAGSQSASTLLVTGTGLTAGTQVVDAFEVSVTGNANAHRILGLARMANERQLQFDIDGELSNRDWQFTVNDLQLGLDGLAAVLESPVSGQLSGGTRLLEPLCLRVGSDGRACASLKQTPDSLAASATISLPAGRTGLESWLVQLNLPALLIDQGLDMQLEMRMRRGTVDDLKLSATVPRLVFPTPEGGSVDVTGISVSATGAGDAIDYTASLQVAGGQITSSGNIFDLHQPQLNGNLVIDLPDLPALSALVSDLDIQGGTLKGDLRLQGPLALPQFTGTVNLADLQLEWPDLGTRHTGQLSFAFVDSDKGEIEGELRSPSGNVNLEGTLFWQPLPMAKVRLTGENFLLADTAELSVAASPDLAMQWEPQNYSLTGKIMIDRAYSSLDLPALQNTVLISNDVVFVEDVKLTNGNGADQVTVDVVAEFKQPGKIDGRGISGEVDGRVRITQQPNKPALANGILKLTGTYRAFGQVLTIESGQLVYTNTSLDDPVISVYATRKIDDITVGVRIDGRVSSLATRLESTPAMPASDILHYLVLGRAPGTATAGESGQLSAAALSLALNQSKAGVQSLGDRIGVTDLGITQELGMLALAVGKQLSPRLYISYTVGLLEPVDIARMRYSLSRFLFLEAEVSDESRAGIHYRIEKD